MKNGIIGVVAGCALAVIATPALAQEEETTVNSRITVNATGGGLHGQVIAPFDTGSPGERPCEADRPIAVFMKTRTGSFNRIATAVSAGDGSWSVRAPREQTIYKIRVKETTFTYSDEYGELKEGTCLATAVVGKKASSTRFKVLSSVLGTRISRSGRGGAAQLPRTGPIPVPFLLLGVNLIGLGSLLLRRSVS